MKEVRTEEAVGQVLCHDVTQIIPGKSKGPVFRKGHVIRKEDIPVLLSVGKEHLFIWENDETMLHENDAARILYDICKSGHTRPTPAKEGKIEVISTCDGLLKIDRKKLRAVNSLGDMMIASRHGNFPVKKGDKIAGTRVIPLIIKKEKMEEAKQAAGDGEIFRVIPFTHKRVGIVTTGSEVYKGRIEDAFTPVLKEKLEEYDTEVVAHRYSTDEAEMIVGCIREMLEKGADMILCTGGMSVDPDDRTPLAIRTVAGEVVSYGAPVLPGAMFLLAYYGEKHIPIVGLPGCVMYAKRTIFDLILPHLMADQILKKEDIDRMGEGGLCLNCENCVFPNCGFGKGW